MEKETRYAVLIDADNVAAKYTKYILDEVSNYGVVTYKRVYGDWTRTNLAGWKNMALDNAITPVQQYSYTTGKNATDSAMIIDAMDILYSHNVDGFCIVSSDSDFTRLAIRLRESGMHVIGMGEQKTPKPFSTACNAFKYLEILADEDIQSTVESEKLEKVELKSLETAIVRIITENANLRDEINIGELGSRLLNRYPDFDVRNYGYSKFSQFLKEFDGLSFRQEGSSILVSQKTSMTDLERIENTLAAIVRTNGSKGYNLGELKKQLCAKIPGFDVKSYGYSKFSKFVENLPSFKIRNNTVMITEN
ncbi:MULTISPECIES: NYN domain-containing protein [Ruminococcus]|uniref:OST-HTH/LOTUS domain-containing protein n=1 Tax=Ruminococcus flavefaciens TaxID=1265 RepID=A0A1M7L6P4_RUMFL|nr:MULTISPECIES: NYN domain-containing protein [Ruminococcus]MCR4793691.1 NYN domain-containing protein [Ruminococcus sp.]SHM73799.1 OST-HTH/LOTUS domain-containing protein [Ruminococcus flavefaciens]